MISSNQQTDLPDGGTQPPRIAPAGESALLVTFGDSISPVLNRRVRALSAALLVEPLPGVIESLPGFASLLVVFDPLLVSYSGVEAYIRLRLEAAAELPLSPPRRIDVPVHYGGAYGPDLDFVAETNHLTTDEVIHLHSRRDYPVYMMGFTPGFPYLGEMDARIAAPRLATPRSRVPAGSVGIAGQQTGIYPLESPGGWRIIGWTPLRLFDLQREPPFLLAPGDLVRFIPAA